jgi:hypothetical protein
MEAQLAISQPYQAAGEIPPAAFVFLPSTCGDRWFRQVYFAHLIVAEAGFSYE